MDAKQFVALSQGARDLDIHYIPTRYPDTENGGVPYENYQQADAEAALDCAQRIVRVCDDLLARSGGGA
ncbi:MAG: hypothetical protein CFK49_11730 [Armatimonadetes bacterium JP3_11]|nr:MAG: hypothetical protein CFK49_11730 [Armatimonadetes bacterium JP3_11]RMH08360.1 MAG: HEPN domain-containing protein [Armatimonadota bacterium]